jgi:hypothetical protein
MTSLSRARHRGGPDDAAPVRVGLDVSPHFGGHERDPIARRAHPFGSMLALGSSTGHAAIGDARPLLWHLEERARTIAATIATST